MYMYVICFGVSASDLYILGRMSKAACTRFVLETYVQIAHALHFQFTFIQRN